MVRLGRVMMEEVIMKKLFVIACAFAAVIGCQKAEMEMPQENGGVKVPVQVTATIAQTKTTMTNEGGVLKSSWKDGDKIYVTQCRDETYDNECVDYEVSMSEGVTEFIKNAAKDFSGPGGYASSRIKLYAMYPDNLGGNRVNNKSFAMVEEQTVKVNRLKQTIINLTFYEDTTIDGTKLAVQYEDQVFVEEGQEIYSFGDDQSEYEW